MADITQLTQPTPNLVKIDSVNVSLLKALGPVINVGDIINLFVRQNQQDGQGLLAYQGNLIPATLPEFLQTGDRISAKVLYQGEQIIFKIIDFQKSAQPESKTQSTLIEKELKALFSHFNASELPIKIELTSQTSSTDHIKKSTDQNAINNMLDNIKASIPNTPALTDSLTTSSLLQAASSGSMAMNIRTLSQSLRELIQLYTPSNAEKFLALIREQLAILDDPARRDSIPAFKLVSQLSDLLKKEAGTQSDLRNKDSQLLGAILTELSQAQSAPESMRNILESIALKLTQIPQNSKILDPNSLTDLQNLASKLESLAHAQETLSQLNPLMNIMGEPALVLFPFIFQGLLDHSKIYIESSNKAYRKNKDSGEAGGSEEPYHRIQVTVPLPTLGVVDVDIAHRSKEILVRFTVEDEQVGKFLLEQLENLATLLRTHGFEQAELVANVSKQPTTKATKGVHIKSSTSIFV